MEDEGESETINIIWNGIDHTFIHERMIHEHSLFLCDEDSNIIDPHECQYVSIGEENFCVLPEAIYISRKAQGTTISFCVPNGIVSIRKATKISKSYAFEHCGDAQKDSLKISGLLRVRHRILPRNR